mgnify:CR=1 FL=1
MADLQKIKNLLVEICKIGKAHYKTISANSLLPFVKYFNKSNLIREELDTLDSKDYSRREILARYLLIRAVIDQGPEVEGIELFARKTINKFYSNNIKILHNPLDFFMNIDKSIKLIMDAHKEVKKIRSIKWAKKSS